MKNCRLTDRNTLIKLNFYFISLSILFALIFLLTVDIPVCLPQDAQFIDLISLLKRNWLALIALILAILGWLMAAANNYNWAGTFHSPIEIKSIKNENYEYLTFLTTYIIPLICIDLTKIRYALVLAILLVLIGFIFIRMNLYCGNPTLALMGYRLYRAKIIRGGISRETTLISKDRLTQGSFIEWLPINTHVWIARKAKK